MRGKAPPSDTRAHITGLDRFMVGSPTHDDTRRSRWQTMGNPNSQVTTPNSPGCAVGVVGAVGASVSVVFTGVGMVGASHRETGG